MMSKKAIALVLCGMFGVTVSLASIRINFGIGGAIGDETGSESYPGDAISTNSIVWIVWSLDNAFESNIWENGVIENDYILYSGRTTSPGLWSGDLDGTNEYFDADVGGNDINAGYLYGVAFNSMTLAQGDWFGWSANTTNTALMPDYESVPGTTPQPTFDFNGGALWEHTDDGNVLVPEPGTMMLAFSGLAVMLIRRLRRRKQ